MKYFFHGDAGHGWLAVKRSELKHLELLDKVSSYSYQRGGTVYLEEDCDASTFIKAKTARNEAVEINERHAERSPIRGYKHFSQ